MSTHSPETLEQRLARRGVSRRGFLKFCGLMAAALALPGSESKVIAQALSTQPRLPVVWLEFQGCTGDTESLLRAAPRRDALVPEATDPSVTEIVLDVLSIDYHETLMVPAGLQAEASLANAQTNWSGRYLCVIEGSIPTADNGVYCTVAGKSAVSIVRQVTSQALATIALGNCAWDGGLAHSKPNPTGAAGVRQAVPGIANLMNLPGCPANVVNLVACIVYYITYARLPELDGSGRPRFAYRRDVHKECERHEHYEHDRYVLAWGDEGHRQGWCLKRMGCRGPKTRNNCPSVLWNGDTSWPIAAGHHCVGCAHEDFWDAMTPFYRGLDKDDEDDERDDDERDDDERDDDERDEEDERDRKDKRERKDKRDKEARDDD